MASAFRAQSDGNVTAIWFKFDEKRQGVEESSRDTGIEDAFVTNFGTESQYVLTPLQKFFRRLGRFEIVCESCKVANCKAGAYYHCAPVQKPRRTPYALMSRDSDESRRAMCVLQGRKKTTTIYSYCTTTETQLVKGGYPSEKNTGPNCSAFGIVDVCSISGGRCCAHHQWRRCRLRAACDDFAIIKRFVDAQFCPFPPAVCRPATHLLCPTSFKRPLPPPSAPALSPLPTPPRTHRHSLLH
jgi:hypothetical protein